MRNDPAHNRPLQPRNLNVSRLVLHSLRRTLLHSGSQQRLIITSRIVWPSLSIKASFSAPTPAPPQDPTSPIELRISSPKYMTQYGAADRAQRQIRKLSPISWTTIWECTELRTTSSLLRKLRRRFSRSCATITRTS